MTDKNASCTDIDALKAAQNVIQLGNWLDHEVRAMASYVIHHYEQPAQNAGVKDSLTDQTTSAVSALDEAKAKLRGAKIKDWADIISCENAEAILTELHAKMQAEIDTLEADRDMWLADSAKQNTALGRRIALHEAAERELAGTKALGLIRIRELEGELKIQDDANEILTRKVAELQAGQSDLSRPLERISLSGGHYLLHRLEIGWELVYGGARVRHLTQYENDFVDSAIKAAAPEYVSWRSIDAELARAIAKFPTWPTDPLHALAVLGEEYGELTKAVLQLVYEPHKSSAEDVRIEAIQTAAMAMRFYESLSVYQYVRGEQHSQSIQHSAREKT